MSFADIVFRPRASYWDLSDATCLQNVLCFPTCLEILLPQKDFLYLYTILHFAVATL